MAPRAGLLVLLLLSAARADDIYPVRGTRPFAAGVMVLEEGAERVTWLDKTLKERSMARKSVGRIEKARCDVHECVERRDRATTAAEMDELARWAEERKFSKDAVRSLYERALAFDANDEAANLALGRVQYKGEWMTPAEKEARAAADDEAAKRAQGLVKWKDEWVTPADKAKLEQGLRKYKGRWLTEDEIKEEEGFVKVDGKWVRKEDAETAQLLGPAQRDTGLGAALRFVQTDHAAIFGDLADGEMATLGQTMERLYAEWKRVFPATDPAALFGGGKYRLYAFRKNPPYQKLVRATFDRFKEEGSHSAARLKQEEDRMKLRLRETSFWDIVPVPQSAHVQMPDPFEGMRAHVVHFATNALATRYGRLRFPTWWLNEGLAYHFELKVAGSIQTFSADVGATGYADQGPGEAQQNPWLDAAKWPNLLLQLVRAGRDPQLEQIKGKNLYEAKNRLTVQDLAKAHSVVTFLILDDTPKFAAFFADAKDGSGEEVEREVAAVLKHYGSYRQIEERWKQYALNGFRLVR